MDFPINHWIILLDHIFSGKDFMRSQDQKRNVGRFGAQRILVIWAAKDIYFFAYLIKSPIVILFSNDDTVTDLLPSQKRVKIVQQSF